MPFLHVSAPRSLAGLTLAVAVLAACASDPTTATPATDLGATADALGVATLTAAATAAPHPVIAQVGEVKVYGGGYGSAIASAPGKPGYVYLLTDRGPNFALNGGIAFPIPDFAPQIGLFKLTSGTLARTKVITLKDAAGHPLTGRPIPPGPGSTGETAFTVDGTPLPLDPNGIDSEGLVALADGSFWISDEYGPFLVHTDADGRQLARIGPIGGTHPLPAVLAKRRVNRGMEGLGMLPDGVTLVGAMQSPLDGNPTRPSASAPTFTRILFYNTLTGATRQVLYPIELGSRLVSEIVALTDHTFLVLERDGEFPGNVPSAIKRVYKIDITGATDVNGPDPLNNADGYNLLSGPGTGKTIEGATAAEVAAAGVVPVTKDLALDIIASDRGFPHDKAEGVAVLDPYTIAVTNDDDFGVTDGPNGLTQKILPLTGETDINRIYVFRLAEALY
jgi:hypothetical protein